MKKNASPRFRERVSYRFDRWMSKGVVSMIGLLFVVTVVVALIVAALSRLCLPETAGSVGDAIWNSFMHIMDTGSVQNDYQTRNVGYILLMITAAVCGLFVTSILIGMITAAFQNRLERLRHGNAKVLEKGHTLILGEDEHLGTVVGELAAANDGEKGAAIVVLCECDRYEMEKVLSQQIPEGNRTRVVCRSGDPTNFAALANAGINRCSRVIALGNSDFTIIKEILAARTLLDECGAPDTTTISAVITEKQNLDAVRIAGGERVEILYFERLIARIFAQTSRQSGLSQVYQELFEYRGNEIYMEKAPVLAGKTFAEIPCYYRNAAVMGLKRSGKTLLNPSGETIIGKEDEIILIAERKGAVAATQAGAVNPGVIRLRKPGEEPPMRFLLFGYTRLTGDIIEEIAKYAAEGSTLTVASTHVTAGEETIGPLRVCREPCDVFYGCRIEELLDSKPDRIIVLAEENGVDEDARTLTILLRLNRYYRQKHDGVVVVSEMLRKKSQALAACAHVNDFVIGTNLAALVLTQVSQNRAINPLFEELLTDEGCEIYIKPVRLFAETGVPMNLYTLTAATALAGQQFLGLRLQKPNGEYTIRLNPDKEETYTFTDDDCAIVLAED